MLTNQLPLTAGFEGFRFVPPYKVSHKEAYHWHLELKHSRKKP